MKTVDTLSKTTFSGRRFTRKQLAQVQETVQLFPHLSRKELAFTICEHLEWTTPTGHNTVNACLTLLSELEAHGIVTLPATRPKHAPDHPIPAFHEAPVTTPLTATLATLAPITLHRVVTNEARASWKAYLQTYH